MVLDGFKRSCWAGNRRLWAVCCIRHDWSAKFGSHSIISPDICVVRRILDVGRNVFAHGYDRSSGNLGRHRCCLGGERREPPRTAGRISRGEEAEKLGVFFGLISAMGQGFGAVLSKKGMYLDVNTAMNPLSAAFIRMMVTGLFVWTIAVLAGKLPELHRALKDRRESSLRLRAHWLGHLWA